MSMSFSFTLQLVICGAFYPNYFTSSDIDEAEVMKVMSGHDPFTTVMVCIKKRANPYFRMLRTASSLNAEQTTLLHN